MWINETEKGITGTEYRNNILSLVSSRWHDENISSIDYNLDGKYKKLSALIGVEDESKNATGEYTVTFYGDGEVIDSFEGLKGGDHGLPVEVNLEGVLKLKIEFKAKDGEAYVLVAEPKLFQ
ncbi:NPCBM/NEW2 domain-containing protein [Paenibacillus amylolyticus]|nr:NPCBM/NEW2 domain-containing protein [Paenibacillus amylolyticus]